MYCEYREFQKKYNCIGGVMVNVLASSVVDRGFELLVGSNQRL
jgi:hypothetical protein